MKVIHVSRDEKEKWNHFVTEQFPPVGAFLQSFEWGEFKATLNLSIERYAVIEKGKWLACFQLEIHTLPFGLRYAYAPRGPVFRNDVWKTEEANIIFTLIASYIKDRYRHFIFVRFEPPYLEALDCYKTKPFKILSYYLQPKYNQVISAQATDEELLKKMSRDIRHDIRAAERIGVTVEMKSSLNENEKMAFDVMKADTKKRSGKNIFPSDLYFTNLIDTFSGHKISNNKKPSLRFFVASKDGEPVALYVAIFFAHTATYLYGASYSGAVSARAPAYLHFRAIVGSHKEGFQYYDLGGVDKVLWPGLTYFKQQYGGETFEYIGTVDVVVRPFLYRAYTAIKTTLSLVNRFKSWILLRFKL